MTTSSIMKYMLLVFLLLPLLFLIRGEWQMTLYWYSLLLMVFLGDWLGKKIMEKP